MTAQKAADTPATEKIGIIAVVPDQWGEHWSTRHQVLTRLAERFEVVWMNTPHEWRESAERLRSGPAFQHPVAGVRSFTVYTPDVWLPRLYSPAALGEVTARAALARAARYLRRRGCTAVVLSLWRADLAAALHQTKYDVATYHIDDEYSFMEVEQPVPPDEQTTLAQVQQVFVHSQALLDKKGPYARQIVLTPNGVDYDMFATPVPEPDDIRHVPHPRVGYVGYIKRQIDWELVYQLAVRHPEWSFPIVGKRSPHDDIEDVLARLEALPNVYFLGEKPTWVMAHYPQFFDVCLLPYRVTAYTTYINPLKLNEYLAAGRPSVGARIPALQGIPDVWLASTPDEWSAAVTEALAPDAQSTERAAQRQAMARLRDWQVVVQQIGDLIELRVREAVAGSGTSPAPSASRMSRA